MLALFLFLPLSSTFLCLGFGRFLGHKGSSWIVVLITLVLWVLSITVFFGSTLNDRVFLNFGLWFETFKFITMFEISIDALTAVMLVVITTITLIVQTYSTRYMKSDPHLPRFLGYLSLFAFSMILFVLSTNFWILFAGWEGVGVCSYLLINFWYTRVQANKSALKAIFVNKIGDLALLSAILTTSFLFQTTDFDILRVVLPLGGAGVFIIPFLLIAAVVGKSAQLGLHVWLPDAMEGPTPVSALLHAATMVTAGVFLVLRCSFIFDLIPQSLLLLVIIGALTAFFGATCSLMQYDLKKIIAFSTCSQLGYMLAAAGSANYELALFHLFNHAFFKALLFLAAGSVIHALNDEQDIRRMGGLSYFLPLTSTFFLIASASLMGLPYLAGFFSKEKIIEGLVGQVGSFYFFSWFLLVITAGLTAFYSFRLIAIVFWVKPNFFYNILNSVQEADWVTQIGLIFLAILSIFSGYLFRDFFLLPNSFFVTSFSAPIYSGGWDISVELQKVGFTQAPLLFTSFFFFFAIIFFYQKCNYFLFFVRFLSNHFTRYYDFMLFFSQRWFFDKFYNRVGLVCWNVAYTTAYAYLDKGFFEKLGPQGFFLAFQKSSQIFRFFSQRGLIGGYIGGLHVFYVMSLVFLFFYF